MAHELVFPANTGDVYYVRIFNSVRQVCRISLLTFEGWVGGNVTDYDVALDDMFSGRYVANFPALDAGRYKVVVYKQAGANPAITDKVRGHGTILWDGVAEVFCANEDDITALLNVYDESIE